MSIRSSPTPRNGGFRLPRKSVLARTIDQAWERYSDAEHGVWLTLYARQSKLLPERACDAFLKGLDALDLHRGGIPDFRRINAELGRLTGWTVVAVPGLVPDDVFFKH